MRVNGKSLSVLPTVPFKLFNFISLHEIFLIILMFNLGVLKLEVKNI